MNENAFQYLPSGVLIIIRISIGVVYLAYLFVYFLFIKNMKDTLNAVRIENRSIQPQKAWLLLIAFINLFIGLAKTIIAIQHWDVSAIDRTLTVVDYVINIFVIIWTFVIIKNIAVSIAEEYNSRGIPVESKPTYNIGIAMCITQAMGILFLRLPYMRLLGGLATSVNFILWIIYWVKINNYKKSLRALSLSNEEGSIFQDLY